MSDIKYIIAGDDGEHTRFPCLAMVRYAMAGAVTMLSIAVIALVIHAVLRSEDVSLSVNNGFIGADNLWDSVPDSSMNAAAENQPDSSLTKLLEPEFAPATIDDGPETDMEAGAVLSADADPFGRDALPREYNHGWDQTPTQVTLKKAKATNLRVVLIANNPSGRTKIDCNDTTVSVFDMLAPYGQIGTVDLGSFTVPPQTTITMQKRLKANPGYIWDNYGGEVRFSVKVRVSANVTSYPLGKQQTRHQVHECQPVTVGLTDDEDIYATDHVDCRSPPPTPQLAPAPAPAPAP